jgi:hypothetical protein
LLENNPRKFLLLVKQKHKLLIHFWLVAFFGRLDLFPSYRFD